MVCVRVGYYLKALSKFKENIAQWYLSTVHALKTKIKLEFMLNLAV